VSRPIGPADNGGVVHAAPGQVVTIALPQPGGTGYQWALDPLPPGWELVDEHTEAGRGAFGAAPGASGRRVFTVRVGEPGGQVTARLRRAWEEPGAAVDSFAVEIQPG
jgi:predicted secreted protein